MSTPKRKPSSKARPRTVSAAKRTAALLPGGVPKWIHVYEDVKDPHGDKYTCVFTGRYTHKTGGEHWYLGISEYGNYNMGSSHRQIDTPSYGHLGKKRKFESLPPAVQKSILLEYKYLWGL